MKIPTEIKQKVVALIESGMPVGKAATKCDVSYSSAYNWALRAEVIERKSHKERQAIKNEDDIRIRELAAAGYSVNDMADITGHTFRVVYQHLLLCNIDFKRSRRGTKRGEMTERIITEMRKGDKNFREIALQFDRSHQYISQLAIAHNIPRQVDPNTKIARAKVMHAEGKSLEEIAATLNQDKSLIRSQLGLPRMFRTRDQNIAIVRKSNKYMQQNRTLKGCAEQLGIKHSTLIALRTTYAQYVKHKELPVPKVDGLPAGEKIEVYVRLGYRNKEISKLIGTSTAHVANYVSKHNLRPENKPAKPMPREQIPDIITYVQDCRANGIPISAVLEIMNINISTYAAWERKFNC